MGSEMCIRDSQKLRRLSARRRQASYAALQRRHPLLEDVGRRIHDPCIDVAELLQAEQRRRMVRIVESVGSGLVDRYRAGVAHRIRRVAGVQRLCGEPEFAGRSVLIRHIRTGYRDEGGGKAVIAPNPAKHAV